jgi:uncharacterized membrane protein YraQ (UPF0718 family)
MFSPRDIANIILHVTLISAFIGIFFFTYASKVEEQIVKDQVNYIVKDFIGDSKNLLGPESEAIKQMLNNIQAPDLEEEDKMVKEQNSKLFSHAMKILVVGVLIGCCTVYWMSTKYDFDLMELIKVNLILLAFVALTEYVFLTYFGASFRSGDPNVVKKIILDSFVAIRNSP